MAKGYSSGFAFVEELRKAHGLLGAYRTAKAYLETQDALGLGATRRDEEEEKFCGEIRKAMACLDSI